MTLKIEIQKTVLGHKAGVEDLAAALGRAGSTVYRWGNPNEESWPPLPELLPLMRATGDYRVLRWFARATGHALLKLPARIPRLGTRTVADAQSQFAKCAQALIQRNAGEITRDEAREAVYQTVELLLAVDRILERGSELNLEEGQKCLRLTQ
ncbi:MAG: hypothetical protein BWY28_02162 [bacterium ADurb.Bin236]|nr:MAG: hypothetical protein BWY28_02162 [bacterium ADurb.Bin236]